MLLQEIRVVFGSSTATQSIPAEYHTEYVTAQDGRYYVHEITRWDIPSSYTGTKVEYPTLAEAVKGAWGNARHAAFVLGRAQAPRTIYLRTARAAIEESAEATLVLKPQRIVSQDFSQEIPLLGRLWLWAKRILPPGL